VEGLSSIQLTIIQGYFFVNQRKNAGTPILTIESMIQKINIRKKDIKVKCLHVYQKIGKYIQTKQTKS